MKASILAVGTRLTTGQIINKNATAISEKLKELGVFVASHLTVPDEQQTILSALKFLEGQLDQEGDLLFVTGGLGPTSDDFTRDVVSSWAGCKMIFDQNSWDAINERLNSRGYTVRDMQKQQCYYPENAEILSNSEGTANAFKLKLKNLTVYVLPGPPREIEAIWKTHIAKELSEKTKNLNKLITKAWDTLGVGESDIAFRIEEIFKNRSIAGAAKDIEIGYRVHLPYVELKLSYLTSDTDYWSPWIKKVDMALEKICVAKDFSDVAQISLEKLKDSDFTFYDYVSDGYLNTRLSPFFKLLKNWGFKQSTEHPSADLFEHEDNFLALLPFEDDKAVVLISLNGERITKTIEAPMKVPLMAERRKQYFSELALVELSKAK